MITVEHLTKCYGDFMAVDDLSFEIEEGHVYGFLGPNGAGKSTTMNIITAAFRQPRGISVLTSTTSLRSLERPRDSSGICRSSLPFTWGKARRSTFTL